MPTPLTAETLRLAKPGAVLWDETQKGLHVRVTPSGAKSFFLHYRVRGTGQVRKPKLGDASCLSLADARKAAQALRKQVALGGDPSGARQAERRAAECTMSALWAKWWSEFGTEGAVRAKKSAANDLSLWRVHIGPALGRMTVDEANRYEVVSALHRRLVRDGKRTQANRVLALLSALFKRAVVYGMRDAREANACQLVERATERKRTRYLEPHEIAPICAALDRWRDRSPAGVAFIHLLLLSGARPKEIANAKWSDLVTVGEGAGRHGVLCINSKTGARKIHLSSYAMSILDRLPQTPDGTLTGLARVQHLWERVRGEAECPDLQLYGLRHGFASVALAEGASLDQIGKALGHSSPNTTARYAHLVDATALDVAQRTGRAIENMRSIGA